MNELIEKFITWWKTGDEKVGNLIFHPDFYYRGCSQVSSGNNWQSMRTASSDFIVLSSFCTNENGSVIFEETDEITLLYYRHSISLKYYENKIIELIDTKELVEKW